jgi:AcrR family transcriptional regulator
MPAAAPAAARAPGAPPGRRARTKARNRAAILAAAREVFGRLGYEAASVRDIVRATDLGVGTFYEYFRDKDDVFGAVAEAAVDGLRARLRAERRDRSRDFEERIERAYLAFFEFVVDERELFLVLERHVRELPASRADRERLAVDELREDLAPDLAATEREEAADFVASAMIGAGLAVARRMLERAPVDLRAAAARAARFCTTFTVAGLAATLPGRNRP